MLIKLAKKKKQGRPSRGNYYPLMLRIYEKDYPRLKKNIEHLSKINKTSINDTIQEICYNFFGKIKFNVLDKLDKLREENRILNREVKQLNKIINKKDIELNILKNQLEKLEKTSRTKSKQEILENKRHKKIKNNTPKKKVCILVSGSLLKELNYFLIDQYGGVFGHIGKSFEKGIRLLLNKESKDRRSEVSDRKSVV